MRIGSRLTNYPMTEKIIYQYVLEILPLPGPVIQVIGAHYLYKLMWERPTEFCILPVKSESVLASCHLWVCVPGRRGGRKRQGPELHFTWHKHVTRCLPVDLLPFAVGKSRVYYMTPNKSSICTPLWSPASVDGPEHWNMNEWGKGRSAGFPPAGSDTVAPLLDLHHLPAHLWAPWAPPSRQWPGRGEGCWGRLFQSGPPCWWRQALLVPPKEEEGEARGPGRERNRVGGEMKK